MSKKKNKTNYKFKRSPYHHQVAALKATIEGFREHNSFALLMEPRTGKTKVAIDAAGILYNMGQVDRVLVTCPISAIGVWVNEIRTNCSVPYRIVIWDKRGRKSTNLPAWNSKRLIFVLVNDDAFSVPGRPIKSRVTGKATGRRSKARGGRFEMIRAFKHWQPQMWISDEMHRFKSVKAAKYRSLEKLTPEFRFKLGLTGTVLTKKKRVHDIYAQWCLLNPDSPLVKDHTQSTFRHEYSVMTDRRGYPQWLREKNPEKLKRLLHAESFAVRRDECFDLPERTYQIIPVELTGHTAEVYDHMAEYMVAKIKTGEMTEASIRLVLNMRLAQITGGIVKTIPNDKYPEGRLVRVGKDKLLVLESRLSDLFEAEEKVVIGARFRADIAAIAALGKKLKVPVHELHGGIDARERQPSIDRFNAYDGPAMFVMQPTAGALGIDLSAAAIFIWYSLPGGNWVAYTQAMDRVALSERPTFFEYLMAIGTVDYIQKEVLDGDGDFAKTITDSPERLLRNFKVPRMG